MALTVEDGTGKDDADAYISVADGDTYNAAHEADAAYDALETVPKEKWIRLATQDIDVAFKGRWFGSRSNEDQALAWPREGMYDSDGYAIAGDALPSVIADACIELAIAYGNGGTRLTATPTDTASVKRTKVRAGPVDREIEYTGAKYRGAEYWRIESLLIGFITTGTQLSRS